MVNPHLVALHHKTSLTHMHLVRVKYLLVHLYQDYAEDTSSMDMKDVAKILAKDWDMEELLKA
jgi:hypothetical protein